MAEAPGTPTLAGRLAELDAAAAPGPWRRGWRDGSGPRYILSKPRRKPPAVVVAGGEDSYNLPEGVLHPADGDLIVFLRNHTAEILAALRFMDDYGYIAEGRSHVLSVGQSEQLLAHMADVDRRMADPVEGPKMREQQKKNLAALRQRVKESGVRFDR